MITAKLGDYFEWMGKVAVVRWINNGQKSIGFQVRKEICCPKCEHKFEILQGIDVIESSPNFQENAKPLPTLIEEK